MSIDPAELVESAARAFPSWEDALEPQAAWTRIAELGWFMASVPEERGGLGLPLSATAMLFAEFGRVLLPGPVIAQFLAVEALAAAADFDGRDALLEGAMAGEPITTPLALGAADGSGILGAVIDADRASRILHWADDRVALTTLVDARLLRRESWDTSRRLFDVELSAGAATLVLASGESGRTLAARLESLRAIALAGDALGVARAALAMSVAYLGDRWQFDRPLAMFQALKHRAADLQTRIAMAEALYGEVAARTPDSLSCGAMKMRVARTARDVVEEAIQFHGGIGLTQEHPVHRFFKRAFLDGELGGNGDHWAEARGRAMLAQRAG